MESKKILLNIAALPVIGIGLSLIWTVLVAISLAIGVILSAYLFIPFFLFFAIADRLATLFDNAGFTHLFFFHISLLISLPISLALTCILVGVLSKLKDKVQAAYHSIKRNNK